jgi:D-sedoheptulose 7-phosphate isomerase
MSTSTYPSKKFTQAGEFFLDYASKLYQASKSVNLESIQHAADLIQQSFEKAGVLYGCGNGGSAAISNHMTCDVMKGVQTDTKLTPRIVSLSSNVEIITAISNDISYDEVFSYQLKSMAKAEDILMTISSSGNSENIIRAINTAKEVGISVIALTGFDGGRSSKIADVNIHVESDNYGIVEDVHQSIMHVLAQYLRMNGMRDELISCRKF